MHSTRPVLLHRVCQTRGIIEPGRRTDALQVGELDAKVPEEGDDTTIVDGNQDNDADGVEESEGCRGNHKGAAEHDPVHGRALHHKKAAHLRTAKAGLRTPFWPS